jgi:ribosomal-protein-alanine N-acetyltransferase
LKLEILRGCMLIGKKVILRNKKLADALDDYTWQADPELARLDAAPWLTISFSRYLLDYTVELRYSYPFRRQFAIDTMDGKHIGNCVYYGINETKGEAELGIMIGNRNYWSKGYGSDAVGRLLDHIFRRTKLKRVYLKTLDSNLRAQKCFQKCGFIQYGHMNRDGYRFVLMEIRRKQWRGKGEHEVKTALASSWESD